MKEQEKSIELAKLMGWDMSDVLGKDYITTSMGQPEFLAQMCLRPYGSMPNDLAQFAAILLKFPEVMMMFAFDKDDSRWLDNKDSEDGDLFYGEPTQEAILDEILRMHRAKL